MEVHVSEWAWHAAAETQKSSDSRAHAASTTEYCCNDTISLRASSSIDGIFHMVEDTSPVLVSFSSF